MERKPLLLFLSFVLIFPLLAWSQVYTQGPQDEFSQILEQFNNPDSKVQDKALNDLQRFIETRGLSNSQVFKLLAHEDLKAQKEAFRHLRILGKNQELSQNIINHLYKLLDSKDSRIRLNVLVLFGKLEKNQIPDEVILKMAYQSSRDSDSRVRADAFRVIVKLVKSQSFSQDTIHKVAEQAVSQLTDQERWVRLKAIQVLLATANITKFPQNTINKIAGLLEHPNLQRDIHQLLTGLGKTQNLSPSLRKRIIVLKPVLEKQSLTEISFRENPEESAVKKLEDNHLIYP